MKQAFLQDIIEHPCEDAPRLVYADWLDENGDPRRAEFIRVQIELARMDLDDERRPALAARERFLRQQHEQDWLGEMRTLVEDWRFERGFVERIKVYVNRFLGDGEKLFSANPVRGVELRHLSEGRPATGGESNIEEVLASPWLARVEELFLVDGSLTTASARRIALTERLAGLTFLEIDGSPYNDRHLCGEGVEALCTSPHLQGLTRLKLPHHVIGQAGVNALTNAAVLPRLVHLDLCNNTLGRDRLAALHSSSRLAQLTELGLASNRLDDGAISDLVSSPHLHRLTWLDLGGAHGSADAQSVNRLSVEAVRMLASCPRLAGLESLFLRDAQVGWEGAQILATCEQFRLRSLNLARAGLDDAAVALLAGSEHLSRLRHLDLANNHLSAAGVRTLAQSPFLQHLEHLELAANPLTAEGAKAIAGSPAWTNLTHLELRHVGLGDEGLSALAAWPGLRSVSRLSLQGNFISARGIQALAASPHAAGLVHLDATLNDLGDTAAIAIAESPYLSGLACLRLSNAGIGDEGAKALARSPWLGRLRTLNLWRNPMGDEGLLALVEASGPGNLVELAIEEQRHDGFARAAYRKRFPPRWR